VQRWKRYVVGRPMATDELEETLLPKTLALPIFASDPLSSVAYATEAALVVLVAASAGAAHVVFPISLGIAALLAVVVASYRQTVFAYESSGGAYVVARENLGRLPSLVAAAALLTDYVLTVAVSVAAGVLALTSAVTGLRGHELLLSLVAVALITLANLRGVREAGVLFALPTYAFVCSVLVLIGTGVGRCAAGSCPQAAVTDPLPAGTGAIGAFVVLRAFASGSTALTGVEAIANGVNAFRRPHGRNAAATLAILGTIAIAMFLGVSWLAVHMHARPNATGTPSVLSEIARGVFPAGSWSGFMYWVVQVLTLAVLVLAANTSFQGFPRLAALLARDRFFARQFTNLGDRLVFSNGIVVLAGDEGRVQRLLEEVWRLPRGEADFVTIVVPEQFQRRSLLSAAGRSSFRLKLRLLSEPGMVVADVPLVAAERNGPVAPVERLLVRVLLADVHGAALRAVNYARSLHVADTRVVNFAFDQDDARQFERAWADAGAPIAADVSAAPYRDIGTPLLAYLRGLTAEPGTLVNVVMPEIVVRGWPRLLHNQRALYLKRRLLFEPNVILSSVPYQVFR
jgi:amino acid transporter